jgi:hypothetical protein
MSADSDADNDGDSDGADFLAWQRRLGSALAATAATAAVPEPPAIVLVVGALVLATRFRPLPPTQKAIV